MQWITTSSPGFQRVTPSPTFQTIPEASEPPMWWSSLRVVAEAPDTGCPSAAHTLLKFTPAAITRTIDLERAGLGYLDLLELEGVDRLALALLRG